MYLLFSPRLTFPVALAFLISFRLFSVDEKLLESSKVPFLVSNSIRAWSSDTRASLLRLRLAWKLPAA